MRIERHPNFKKSFKKRISKNPKLVKQASLKTNLFQKDPSNLILKDHALKGAKRKFRSFSVTGDIRIVYQRVSKNQVIFYDIGTHPQVY